MGRGLVDRSGGGDAEPLQDDALQPRAHYEVEGILAAGEKSASGGPGRLDEAQRLTQRQVAVLGKDLGGDVHHQSELAEAALLLGKIVGLRHPGWANTERRSGHSRWLQRVRPCRAANEGGWVMEHGLLGVAITAAHLGGEMVRERFGKLGAGEVEEKARNDWVSTADRAAEEAIATYLLAATPQFGILAEEGGAVGATGARWVVDPLDGTANFVHGFPHFAVSVALVVEGDLAVGVIYDPMRDETFSAVRGGGAFRNGRRMTVSGRSSLNGSFITTGFPFRVASHIDTYLEVFREVFFRAAALRRPGAAALDLAHVAAGIFDGFFEFSLSPWDVAAGTLIVREAGGVVTDLEGGDDVLTRGNVVAATPAVHRELLEIMSGHCREAEITP